MVVGNVNRRVIMTCKENIFSLKATKHWIGSGRLCILPVEDFQDALKVWSNLAKFSAVTIEAGGWTSLRHFELMILSLKFRITTAYSKALAIIG